MSEKYIRVSELGVSSRNPAVFNDPERAHGWNDLLKIVQSATTYTPADILAGMWVPVTPETLPTERGYPPVNCCHIEDGWSDAAIVTKYGHFINSEGMEIYPTHWMPLPQPPKEATP